MMWFMTLLCPVLACIPIVTYSYCHRLCRSTMPIESVSVSVSVRRQCIQQCNVRPASRSPCSACVNVYVCCVSVCVCVCVCVCVSYLPMCVFSYLLMCVCLIFPPCVCVCSLIFPMLSDRKSTRLNSSHT